MSIKERIEKFCNNININTVKEAKRLLEENGIILTEEEIGSELQFLQKYGQHEGELSDDELDRIVGGIQTCSYLC